MYDISVPIMSLNVDRVGREATLRELEKLDTKRVFLALSCYQLDPKKRASSLAVLKENCMFFQERGYEVGSWVWTFMFRDAHPFTPMIGLTGNPLSSYACPLDEDFSDFVSGYIRDIAKSGLDMIMFDDDFRYGFLGKDGPGCLCDRHMARIQDIVGESCTREQIREHVLAGSPNKYRNAFLQANGDAFRLFARKVRAAADSVNPNVRMGACACMTSWDIDGIQVQELARILAGNTRPFTRLIGAPYWAVKHNWGNELPDTIDMDRMEAAWVRNADPEIEIMAEGDSFPRPRTTCPASYLECFDMAIRAAGCTDGIMKYGIDYFSNIETETGYTRYHQRNKPLYRQIHAAFSGKVETGVRVYTYSKKVADGHFAKTTNIEQLIFPRAARSLSACTVPITFSAEGITGAVFGEDARHLPMEALANGMILDTEAARILAERGVDVGIAEFGKAVPSGRIERFLDPVEEIFTRNIPIYQLTLKDGAQVLSDNETAHGLVPMSLRYENAQGQRFLIINVDSSFGDFYVLKHYARSQQYANTIPWLCGKKLPAYSYGNPNLYNLCKKDGESMSVGLWNLHADIAFSPIVELDGTYCSIEFMGCSGELLGDKVRLGDIPAFEFAGFTVRK